MDANAIGNEYAQDPAIQADAQAAVAPEVAPDVANLVPGPAAVAPDAQQAVANEEAVPDQAVQEQAVIAPGGEARADGEQRILAGAFRAEIDAMALSAGR